MRGNHETYVWASDGNRSSYTSPILPEKLYPQTRGLSQDVRRDQLQQPRPIVKPPNISLDLAPMSYSFDYNNARFVIVNPWVTAKPEGQSPPPATTFGYSITEQQPWISSRLDKMFARYRPCLRDCPISPSWPKATKTLCSRATRTPTRTCRIPSTLGLSEQQCEVLLAGHDHMNQHSIIASPDGDVEECTSSSAHRTAASSIRPRL